MFLSKLASRVGIIAGIGCTIHCFFEYVCDFVVCTGECREFFFGDFIIFLEHFF